MGLLEDLIKPDLPVQVQSGLQTRSPHMGDGTAEVPMDTEP